MHSVQFKILSNCFNSLTCVTLPCHIVIPSVSTADGDICGDDVASISTGRVSRVTGPEAAAY